MFLMKTRAVMRQRGLFCRPRALQSLFKLLVSVICLIVLITALYVLGIRINTSSSVPVGIWKIQKADIRSLSIGDCVAVNKAYISTGVSAHLLKYVAALPGDVMSKVRDSVYRNGCELPLSTIKTFNSHGETLGNVDYPMVVPDGHIWLHSLHVRGFDSRYFGPVPVQKAVIGRATLLWEW